MRHLILTLIAPFLLALTACSESSAPPAAPASDTPKLMEGQRAALEKAKQTEQVILETDEKRRKEMEEQGL